ncbi:MAG: SMC-Scp complex subunit ScpB [Lachnospiraceae bacterium]|nr:SMC-Scp complex subunit ScpB [Lachnospiraceae bacterium]
MRVDDLREQELVVEAVLFTMGQSVEIRQLAAALETTEKEAAAAAERLRERYDEEERGMQILRLEDSYQMSTRAKFYSNLIKVAATPKKQVLSDVVMETLAIIAYKQPVTKADIEKIRGVKSDHAVNRLIEYNLVYEAGRMDAPGRPALFATTEEFLRRFGVSSTVELPEMNMEQREEIKSEVEEELNLKLNGDGLPMSDEELAALAEAEAENIDSDIVTEDSKKINYTEEEINTKINEEDERHEMQ